MAGEEITMNYLGGVALNDKTEKEELLWNRWAIYCRCLSCTGNRGHSSRGLFKALLSEPEIREVLENHPDTKVLNQRTSTQRGENLELSVWYEELVAEVSNMTQTLKRYTYEYFNTLQDAHTPDIVQKAVDHLTLLVQRDCSSIMRKHNGFPLQESFYKQYVDTWMVPQVVDYMEKHIQEARKHLAAGTMELRLKELQAKAEAQAAECQCVRCPRSAK